jgi:ubiquitin-protein ligase
MSNVRLRRLQADYDKLRAFLAQQPRIRLIQAQGAPPERYQLEFQINGLREVDEQLQTVANHMVEISLPLSYPRLPPQCRMLTPVFHPNIAPHAICIGDHWSAGEPLWSMVARIGEMIAYQSYNTKSPLNGEAARWVEANQDRLPLDHTNFIMDMPASRPEPADPSIIPFADRSADFSPPAAVPRSADFSPPVASAVRPIREVDLNPPLASVAQPPSPPAAPNIVIECGQCQSRYSVPPTAGGRKVRCKKCQAILVIPLRQPLP